MKIFDIAKNIEIKADISLLSDRDMAEIKRSSAFQFDWTIYEGYDIYKITRDNDDEILGLICLIDAGDDFKAMKIELLEIGKHNVGPGKQLDKIAGCLIAFACRESFKIGREGWVFLKPKNVLIEHYCKKYGFEPAGMFLVLDTNASLKLIKQYL